MNTHIEEKSADKATELILSESATVFDMLGIDNHMCTKDDVKKQFKKVAVLIHPDKNPHTKAGDAFMALNDAVNALIESELISNAEVKPMLMNNMKRPRGRAPKGKTWNVCSGWVGLQDEKPDKEEKEPPTKRPRGRAPKGKVWVDYQGWVPMFP